MNVKTVFIAVLTFWSCSTIEDCQNDPNRSFLIIRFNHSEIVAFDSIRVNDQYRLADDTDTLTTLGAFLDPTLNQSLFTFYTDSIDYELEISYENQVQIFDIDCNPSLNIYNLDTISHSFDSLVISQTVLTNSNFNGDIQIYF